MARGLSYADAVRVLGGREDRTVAALDRLAGGLLLVASAAGAGFAMSLFDPKSELARLSGDLVSGLAERLRGVSRLGRSERLAAAHAVIVLTAYFEALREASLPFDVKELKLTGSEQVAVATGGAAGTARLRTLADALLRADVPMPAAQRPYELTLETLNGFYQHLSDEVCQFVTGLDLWDRLNDTRRQGSATPCGVTCLRGPSHGMRSCSGDWRLISPKLLSGRIWWTTRRLALRSGR